MLVAMSAPGRAASFDVVCAGEARWDFTASMGTFGAGEARPRFRPSGGAVNAALALAQGGIRVGLAAVLADDAPGRALMARLEAAGVDVGGVALALQRPGILVVEPAGAGRRVLRYRAEDDLPVTVPPAWSAPVLLLSGLSPALAYGAELCRAARAARRAGTIVVVDVNARRHVWAGQDPRAIRALLGEADVVRYSRADLAALGIDAAAMRAASRRGAVLVQTDGAGAAWATGPFGEVAQVPRVVARTSQAGAGDAFTAAICAELARAGEAGERADVWERALRRGHAAASARIEAVSRSDASHHARGARPEAR
jgi:2-dehydro-3-deoxygluconokinase